MWSETSCVVCPQTEPPGPSAEPSDGRRHRGGAELRAPDPSLGAPASGHDEAPTAAGAAAAEAPPGTGRAGQAVRGGSSAVLGDDRHFELELTCSKEPCVLDTRH